MMTDKAATVTVWWKPTPERTSKGVWNKVDGGHPVHVSMSAAGPYEFHPNTAAHLFEAYPGNCSKSEHPSKAAKSSGAFDKMASGKGATDKGGGGK